MSIHAMPSINANADFTLSKPVRRSAFTFASATVADLSSFSPSVSESSASSISTRKISDLSSTTPEFKDPEDMDLTPSNSKASPVDDMIRPKPRIALVAIVMPILIEKFNSPHTPDEAEVLMERCGAQSPRPHLYPAFGSTLPK